MNTVEQLEAALAYFEGGKKWYKGGIGNQHTGAACSVTALGLVLGTNWDDGRNGADKGPFSTGNRSEAKSFLDRAACKLADDRCFGAVSFNDGTFTTFEDITKLFTIAIQLAKEAENA